MSEKGAQWRPGQAVCRCCLAEGCYKDISTEYFWMGKREVYADMLVETFDVNIGFSQAGGPSSSSRLICEPCISRLRDASEFKRQVLECEKTFQMHLEPGGSGVTEIEIHLEDRDVKLERVKQEKAASDDDNFFDRDDFFEDDDDMDDEPLTKLATKIPKKETVDLLDLLDSAKGPEKRKSTTKAKVTPAKKVKVAPPKAAPPKATPPRAAPARPSASKVKPIEKKKKDEREHEPARRNAEILLKYTTAFPFRVNVKSILCVYCLDLCDHPAQFREHMCREHATYNIRVAFARLPKSEFVKADLSDLACRICDTPFDSLDKVADHLKLTHHKAIQTDSPLGVMPYKLEKDKWDCAVCAKSSPSLLHLNKHTITHFLSYVCDICGKSYVASTGLLQHVRSKHEHEYKVTCRRCQQMFPSLEAKTQHQKTEKRCMPHCCSLCSERFPNWELKQRHLTDTHGRAKHEYQCPHCDVTCADRRAFYDHFKMLHSEECLVCMHCGLKFASTSRLNRHLGKHAL